MTADHDKIVESFKKLLEKRKTGPVPSWETSTAALKPSLAPKNIKVKSLKTMRQVYALQKQGLSRKLIAEKMGFISEALMGRKCKGKKDEDYLFVEAQYEAAYRKVSRHRATVEKILKNVAKGIFP